MVETTSRMASSSSTTRIFSVVSVCIGTTSPSIIRQGPPRPEYRCSFRKQHASFTRVPHPGVLRVIGASSRPGFAGILRVPLGRRRSVLENQGLSAVAFFEVTAFLILLVLFVLLRKDHPS